MVRAFLTILWPRIPCGLLLAGSPLLAFWVLSYLPAVAEPGEQATQENELFAGLRHEDAEGRAMNSPLDGRILPAFKGTPLGLPQSFVAHTDRGNSIGLLYYPNPPEPTPEMLADEEEWVRERGFAGLLIRTAPPCGTYVCHDWVFTGGRFAMGPGSVDLILADNGYHPIDTPRVGDLAVYRDAQTGVIMHTAIVRVATENGPVIVESKWAWMGRYLHPASVYCCPDAVCQYYRSERAGHLLQGIDPAERDAFEARPAE